MYWDIEDEEEYNRCYMQLVYGDESEATLREWFGDDYDYYFGTPCDYSKIGVSYMTCRYNAETYHDTQWHHYTDCSSVIRDCVGNDAVTIINAEYNTYSADVFPVELTAKNIDQNNLNNIDWDEYFYQHLERYQQDIYNPSNLEHYENACYTTWTHSINYHNLSGATNNNPISYTASLLPMELSGLSRDRYTFMGWCSSVISGDDVECPAGDLVTEIPVGSITDIDLYATWRTSYEFFIDTTKDTVGEFTLYISAAGRFFIDWGDDSPTEVINKSDTDSFLPITHTYETQKSYTISIGGTATDYSEEDGVLYINYDNGREFVAALRGSLGHVFPTIRNSNDQIIAQPKFKNAFSDCTSLESISADLFDDVTGATSQMFYNTFAYTPIASIHSTLFSGITGAAAEMFAGTFAGTSITSIPATLFSGITGAATEMFAGTFAETQITFIPAGLFNGVTGAAEGMFSGTFAECTELGADPKITAV